MKYTERQMYAVKLYAVSFRLYRAGTIDVGRLHTKYVDLRREYGYFPAYLAEQ